MKYFFVDYITRNGEHEYTEHAVAAAHMYITGEKKAVRGRKFFTHFGWEEFCEYAGLYKILFADDQVLKNTLKKYKAVNIPSTSSTVVTHGPKTL